MKNSFIKVNNKTFPPISTSYLYQIPHLKLDKRSMNPNLLLDNFYKKRLEYILKIQNINV